MNANKNESRSAVRRRAGRLWAGAALLVAALAGWACAERGERRPGRTAISSEATARADLASQQARLEELWGCCIEWSDPRVELGRELFFEPLLSSDGTVACATCHDVRRGFADPRSASVGVKGRTGHRNAPTLLNADQLPVLFWDGRAISLEEQVEQPVTSPAEMGQPSRASAAAVLAAVPRYRRAFRRAYGREVRFEDVADALARFERSLVFRDSPADSFLAGEAWALSEQERKGHALFTGKALCTTCHLLTSEPLGTDGRFHNLGVGTGHPAFKELAWRVTLAPRPVSLQVPHPLALGTDLARLGRFVVTGDPAELGAYRTSPLRNVGLTAPYMHDGSLATLWDVVDFYDRGGEPNPYLDEVIRPLGLSEEEVDQLVLFLFSLTDRAFALESQRELARQSVLAKTRHPRVPAPSPE